MILVTGGLGFLGAHTARALLDFGESCVLTRHHNATVPVFLTEELDRRIVIEPLDCADREAFLDIGRRHRITGIVHLAASGLSADPLNSLRADTAGVLNALEAARAWEVHRIAVASTVGVYFGASGNPWREDVPLPMVAPHPIPVVKKAAELFAALIAERAGFEVVNLRIGAIWGPLGPTDSPFFPLPRLVDAAVRGIAARCDAYADDGGDLCYVKDCARAIVLLQLADRLNHRTYNIASGRPTKNGEVVAAIKAVVPGAEVDLPDGRGPDAPADDHYLDITRLREDTGFRPRYPIEHAIAEYVAWRRAGNPR